MSTITLGPDGANPPTESQKADIRTTLGVFVATRTAAEGAPTNLGTATGVVTFTLNPTDGRYVFVGGVYYKFRTTPAVARDVAIGGDIATSASNLAAAINSGDGFGGAPHTTVDAVSDPTTVTVTAKVAGEIWNAVTTTTDVTGASWAAATLTGGYDAVVTEVIGQLCRVGDAEPYDWYVWTGDSWAAGGLLSPGPDSGVKFVDNGAGGLDLALYDQVTLTYRRIRLSNGAFVTVS